MIRKPNVVRGIPTLIVRALPTLYYYGRYAGETIPTKAKSIFDSYVKYLSEALTALAPAIQDKRLDSIIADAKQLSADDPHKVESRVYEMTRKLSQLCTENSEAIKKAYEGENGLKKKLVELFCDIAERTKILIIDNNDQPEWVENLSSKLTGNCYYDVEKTKIRGEDFSDKIVNSDFVIFASAIPQSIHEDIELLDTYKKPGLVLGSIQKDEKLDHQMIRNGSWLKNKGYDVLYKIFSPIRLFTTIDKINIRYLLQKA